MSFPFNFAGERGDSNCITISSEAVFKITFDEAEWSSGGAEVSVIVQNISDSYKRGIVKLIAKDKDSNVVGIAVNEILAKNKSEFRFKAAFLHRLKISLDGNADF